MWKASDLFGLSIYRMRIPVLLCSQQNVFSVFRPLIAPIDSFGFIIKREDIFRAKKVTKEWEPVSNIQIPPINHQIFLLVNNCCQWMNECPIHMYIEYKISLSLQDSPFECFRCSQIYRKCVSQSLFCARKPFNGRSAQRVLMLLKMSVVFQYSRLIYT